jgi:hypothetical protein
MPAPNVSIFDIELIRRQRAMLQPDRIEEYLKRLTPLARSNLLIELERLEVCGTEMPGTAAILGKLRAEFRNGSQATNQPNPTHRVASPSRHFFAPLEPLLVDGAPDHANTGRIFRGSLAPIWEWITRDLLPTMARDYVSCMTPLIAADKQLEARVVVAAFQSKVVKYLESTLGAPDGAERTRVKLATYTASRAAYRDLNNMLCVLRARDALARFGESLPAEIQNFDDSRVSALAASLETLGKTNADVVPFALGLVARRLETQWQLIRLATRAARGKSAAEIAATPYAITVSMVLDWLENKRSALRVALKNERILDAKGILAAIYDAEYALQVRIDGLDQSDWGERLRRLMNETAVLVEAEVSRFPDHVEHVLRSRSLRSHDSLGGRLTYLAWKGRDALSGGAGYLKKLIGPQE